MGGGLKREPVEELLKRVQWEYSQLYYDHKRLREELARRDAEPGSSARTEQLENQIKELAAALERRDAEIAPLRQELAAREADAATLRQRLGSEEQKRLREDLGRRDADPGSSARTAQLEQEVKALSATLERRDAEIGPLRQELAAREADLTTLRQQIAAATEAANHQVPPRLTAPSSEAPHRDIDELGRIVLANAHRASIELRESTRRECELTLKKARARIAALAAEFEDAKGWRTREVAELEASLSRIRNEMRATLQSLDRPGPGPSEAGTAVDPKPETAESEEAVDPLDPDGTEAHGELKIVWPVDPPGEDGGAGSADAAGSSDPSAGGLEAAS
jgi:chromosome segregation ATPase